MSDSEENESLLEVYHISCIILNKFGDFFIHILCLLKSYAFVNNIVDNFKQIIKRHKGGNTLQTVIRIFGS